MIYADGDIFYELSPRYSAESNGAIAQKDAEVRLLEPGKPIERQLAGGEAHSYRITLSSGQYALVAVDQRRINIAVSAFGPDGKKLVEADMFPIGDAELVSLVAETSASYRLEVRAPDKSAPKGRYEIKIKELRAATEEDKSAVAAERLVAEGILLDNQLTADTWRKAIEKYQQSLPLWQSAKDPAWEATALYLISNAYINLGEKQKALDFANQALPPAQAASKVGDEEKRRLGLKVEANTLDTIGRVYNEFGDKKKALELFNQSLPLRRAIGDRAREADTLGAIGRAYHLMGDYQKALEIYNQARLTLSELDDRRKESSLLASLCGLHNDLGDHKKAMDSCNQALAIKRELKDRWGEATALNNLAGVYSSLGEYQKALDLYTQAHAMNKEMGSRQGQAIALNNIGFIYDILGEYQKSIDFLNQGLEIFRATGDKYREIFTLSNIAVGYSRLKDYKKALDINLQMLPIRHALNDNEGEAITLGNIANCYQNLGEKQKALDYYAKARALHRDPQHLATTLRNIGTLYRDSSEPQKAMDYFNEAIQLSRTIGDRNGEARILFHIARVERDRGNMAEAKKRIEEALAAVESLRVNIKSQQLRASFFASVRNYHEFYIDLLMRLDKQRPREGFDAAAFEASERGRARSLLELLAEAHAEIRQGIDPALQERERALRQMIADKAQHQVRLLGGKHNEEEATAAAKEIDALTTDYEQLLAQIRQTSPRYAALTQPVPLTLKEIQTEVLDRETLLLEYALGEEKSFLWSVTPTSISSFELPKRAEIETSARHVYEILTARNRTVPDETPEQRRLRLEQTDAEYPKASAALSQMLLGPVAAELKNKRLLIVGEGVLQYTPFAALPAPAASEEQSNARVQQAKSDVQELASKNWTVTTDHRPLISDHEIIGLPSASVLGVLRRETAGRKIADKTVALFADPVFDSSDPRVGLSGKKRATAVEEIASTSDVKRSAKESGLQGFVRLRFSRQEADDIARLIPEGKKLKAVDFAASRAAATSPELEQYAILHFATHALINNQHPELSGIVLSLVDEQGRPQNGFLRLYDIYNLKLGADLVVLSACQTALGKEIKGEGLVGLARGFMYAGAPRVVASLWQIDDRATAELMRRFYKGVSAGGLRPAAALRAAQTSMWGEKRWRAPHYWAAFTLQGEWK
jgi:CHAT domain-containing protein/Tfp pilus assembly protein PilF